MPRPFVSYDFLRSRRTKAGVSYAAHIEEESRMRVTSLAALCLAACLSFAAVADDAIVVTGTPQSLRAAQDALKRDLAAKKGEYAHLSDDEKRTILRKQEAIYALIDGRESFDGLHEDDKRRLANAVEEVRALVAKAEDDRMICERVKVLGSNRPQNKCISVGERRRLREQAQQQGLRAER